MLTLVLAESALETIPKSLWHYPSVQKYAKLRRKRLQFVLLDRSYHHMAMRRMKQSERRGRPDIIHFALLEALSSPLNKEGLLKVYVHTLNNYVIAINPKTRLPRNYNRFVSLIEQLFEFERVPPPSTRTALLTLKRQKLLELIQAIKPSHIVAFSRVATPKTIEEAILKIVTEQKPVIIVGGFPRGHFSKATAELADDIISIDSEMLETWTVVSRIVYEFECALSLPIKRKRLSGIS